MSEILHINDETFDQTVNSDTTVFVDFWAPWCGPCRMLAPRLEQAAETFDGRAVIAKYNCDEASDKAAQYGVRGIPTVIAFKKGEVIDQRTVPATRLRLMRLSKRTSKILFLRCGAQHP